MKKIAICFAAMLFFGVAAANGQYITIEEREKIEENARTDARLEESEQALTKILDGDPITLEEYSDLRLSSLSKEQHLHNAPLSRIYVARPLYVGSEGTVKTIYHVNVDEQTGEIDGGWLDTYLVNYDAGGNYVDSKLIGRTPLDDMGNPTMRYDISDNGILVGGSDADQRWHEGWRITKDLKFEKIVFDE